MHDRQVHQSYNLAMLHRSLASILLGTAIALAAGCASPSGQTPTAPSAGVPASVMTTMSGTWRSAAAGTPAGPCSGITYTVTPSGATTASVTYAATCSGVSITGSGSGTANGDTIAWSTTGAAGVCSFTLTGTATPTGTSTAKVTYAGTVCGLQVSGADTVTR